MKAKLISNDPSLNLMFRLGAIETEQVEDLNHSIDIFNKTVEDNELAVLILSKQVYDSISTRVENYRENESKPLIVVIDGWLEEIC